VLPVDSSSLLRWWSLDVIQSQRVSGTGDDSFSFYDSRTLSLFLHRSTGELSFLCLSRQVCPFRRDVRQSVFPPRRTGASRRVSRRNGSRALAHGSFFLSEISGRPRICFPGRETLGPVIVEYFSFLSLKCFFFLPHLLRVFFFFQPVVSAMDFLSEAFISSRIENATIDRR